MRIIAGKFRSRQLRSLKGATIRPTSDRLRETLFNVLGELVVDARFLDCFAGTGAIGIEALSRGARDVIFIERQNAAATLIQKNLESLEIKSGARVMKLDAMHALRRLAEEGAVHGGKFDICFLDPPYAEKTGYNEVLSFLGEAPLMAANGIVIAEHERKLDLPASFGTLECVRVLRQGDAALTFYRVR
jgi:16S rRNA (guanine966-N2)-methyltransferase